MRRAPRRGRWALWAVVGAIVLAADGQGLVLGHDERGDAPEGPAPVVHAVEIEAGPGVSSPSEDAPPAAPTHPPIHRIPPVRVLEETARKASGPGSGISHDSRTGTTTVAPAGFDTNARLPEQGGGYAGADGGLGEAML